MSTLSSLTITELRSKLTAGEITPFDIIDDLEKSILEKAFKGELTSAA